jgi:hypothetical protein
VITQPQHAHEHDSFVGDRSNHDPQHYQKHHSKDFAHEGEILAHQTVEDLFSARFDAAIIDCAGQLAWELEFIVDEVFEMHTRSARVGE